MSLEVDFYNPSMSLVSIPHIFILLVGVLWGYTMVRVGIVGWRGMVGSVLTERMIEQNDFADFDPYYFSTSQIGWKGPDIGINIPTVKDANSISELMKMHIILSCQGSSYTRIIHKKLRNTGWKGYWIDAASELRMSDRSILVLDPVNKKNINDALANGILDYIGGNCTVALLLMALHGLIENNWVDWITSMTYQAVSGAGSNKIKELIFQMQAIGNAVEDLLDSSSSKILEIDRKIKHSMDDPSFPTKYFGTPIAANLIPWIDTAMGNGQTREEWKTFAETNKILGLTGENAIPIDGQCVRVATMRCHSQALTVKLKRDIPVGDIENCINSANDWVEIIPNNERDTVKKLNPSSISGSLNIPVGRIRKLNIGPRYLTAFTVGDQLLWGAAEPIRRALNMIVSYIS